MEAVAPDRVAGSKLAVAAFVVCACAGAVAACGYRPGSFSGPAAGPEFAGERATVGCLDVAVSARPRPVTPMGQVVEIDFANRCDRALTIDFTALRAFGRDEDGGEHPLAVYDPHREIRPLGLEARTVGREVLELRRAVPAGAVLEPIRSTCVDVSRLAGRAEHGPARAAGGAPAAARRWLCVARATEARSAAAEAP